MSVNYKLQTKKPHTAILSKLISLASIGAVLFTPGIPSITKFFGISEGFAQSALTLFLVGYALGQILYSPIANRFGRKPTLYLGLAIAILGSFLSGLSKPLDSYSLLIISRLITSLGASVGLVLSLTIINDYYYEHQARKVVPLVSTAFAIIPFLGVAIGGILVHHFGWVSTFYFLMCYYIVVLFFVTRLPETGVHLSREETRLKVIWSRYKMALKDRRLVTFSILFGITTGMIYIFAASAPIVAIDILKLSPQRYGFINLLIAIFYVAGNLLAAALNKHISALKMILIGFVIFGSAFIALFICFMSGNVNPYTFFIPFIVAYFGFPIAFSNAIVLASNHYEDRATGSAVMNFINMLMPVLGVLVIQNLPGPTTLTMPSLLLGLSVAYLLLFIYSKRYVR